MERILDVFGPSVGIGYDIGCSFHKTVQCSSLASQVNALKVRFVVPAFHGYVHNRQCQLLNHPLYITGFGLEDIETCECMFSVFNGLAPVTCYSSPFHRHQAIDMYVHTTVGRGQVSGIVYVQ